MRLSAKAVTLLVGLLALVGSGCGSSTANVSGEVTYKNAPVEGHIIFTPADGMGREAGAPISAGRYRITGMTPGTKIVRVIATKAVNFASTSEEMKLKADEARKLGRHDGLVEPADVIPENAEGNNATVELELGEQTKNFALHPPSKKK